MYKEGHFYQDRDGDIWQAASFTVLMGIAHSDGDPDICTFDVSAGAKVEAQHGPLTEVRPTGWQPVAAVTPPVYPINVGLTAEAGLHARCEHPGFEYATTNQFPRGEGIGIPPLDEHGNPDPTWEPNTDAGHNGFRSWVLTEDYFWRRPTTTQPAPPGGEQ